MRDRWPSIAQLGATGRHGGAWYAWDRPAPRPSRGPAARDAAPGIW